jgi:hypothetical protein
VNRIDRFTEFFVCLCPLARGSMQPFVVTTPGDLQDVAKELNRVGFSLGLDKGIALYFWPAK